MWGQKEKASATKTPPATSGQPATPPGTAQAPASRPGVHPPADRDRSGRVQARIGNTIKIKGELTGSEDFHVDGEVEGTIELHDNALVVGPNGHVRAQVKARSITIWGNLEGKMHASERVEVRKTGSLTGDLVTPRIVTEDGAVLRGSIDIGQPSPWTAQRTALAPARGGRPERHVLVRDSGNLGPRTGGATPHEAADDKE